MSDVCTRGAADVQPAARHCNDVGHCFDAPGMGTVFLIALGGAIGALGRYTVVSTTTGMVGASHYGTLLVNIVGSLLMGLVAGEILLKAELSEGVRLGLVVGVLGGFTTFSAFSLDVFNLYDEGRVVAAAAYASASVAASVTALFAGIALARELSEVF